MSLQADALRYHTEGRPGKIEIALTKPCETQRDLSLAYSPGVAYPCLEIQRNPDRIFDYTAQGNLVAVISNGTAVLGLGDIGAAAGKPVMEGKGVLFKRFADIDVFDIEIDEKDPQKLIDTIARLEPTFGGINLEDIKAPECFLVETELKKRMNIPVFHDDQHGTAIISGAGLINAAELSGKPLDSLKIAVSGAGASAIACMTLWQLLGVKNENILMCDSHGVLHEGRRGQVDVSKEPFLRVTEARTLTDALTGADVFVGLSKANTVTGEMLQKMAAHPIIFALANPDPEIPYPEARAARPDAIIGTGRSDYPNQVNNVLGFPYIFRGALDVGARQINDAMKLAAVRALAALAKEDVPDRVRAAYGGATLRFGLDYILPKPVDERVLLWVAPAVAKAAIDTGVARRIVDPVEYREALERRLGPARSLMRQVIHRVSREPKRVLFSDGDDERVLRALPVLIEEKIARPVLIGDEKELRLRAEALEIDLTGVEFVPLIGRPSFDHEVAALLQARGRRGMSAAYAKLLLQTDPMTVSLMMLRERLADGAVVGLQHTYPDTIRAALQLLGTSNGAHTACGVHVLLTKKGPLFLADTSVNPDPDAKTLAETALLTAHFAKELGVEPHIALVSYSNFGASRSSEAVKSAEAVALVKARAAGLDIDGEMQVQLALDPEARQRVWPQSTLHGAANVLVFPNLAAANTAYQLLGAAGGAEAIGPVLLGLGRPLTVVPPTGNAETIVQMTAMTVLQALED
jgi:malate dehydrogenase (oxaloacetate-decarboxylating)(NADP+)